MQKLLTQYTQITLWTIIVLIVAVPAYIVYDFFIRQPQKVEATKTEYVERGSYQFAANQCWRCHGYKGEGGIGLPLNQTQDIGKREAKSPFIYKTIARGRPSTRGENMPAWHKDEGGPLDTEDIKMLREFILDGTHWGEYFDFHPVDKDNKFDPNGRRWKRTENFLAEHNLIPPPPPTAEERGKALFNSPGPCAACHNTTSETRPGIEAPGLAGIYQKDKLPNGKPVNDENLKEWIRKGSATYKPPTASSTPPFMPPYEGVINTEDKLNDLLAFLKTLKK